MIANVLATVGMVLSFAATVCLARGLLLRPSEAERSGITRVTLMLPDGSLDRGPEPKSRRRATLYAWWGIGLAIPGVAVQLIAVWL